MVLRYSFSEKENIQIGRNHCFIGKFEEVRRISQPIGKKKGYKYYACYKNGHDGGTWLPPRDTCKEAYRDLKQLETYLTNDVKFIGVVKTKDNDPLKHINCQHILNDSVQNFQNK